MRNEPPSILFLGAKDNYHCSTALAFCQSHFTNCSSYLADWGDRFPAELLSWEGDYVVSFLSRWLVPESVLTKAREAGINFHPGPPEYPGIGCYNFALYEAAEQYGVTCHHMAPKVDSGALIEVTRFPVFTSDDVASLLQRSYDHQLVLFYKMMELILEGGALPSCPETWTRAPFTRRQLDDLARITVDMSKEEVKRRVRATSYGKWRPVIEHEGFVFELAERSQTGGVASVGRAQHAEAREFETQEEQ